MKTNILFLALIMLFALTTTNCKKDETTAPDEEVFELSGKFIYNNNNKVFFQLYSNGTGYLNGNFGIKDVTYYHTTGKDFTIIIKNSDSDIYTANSDNSSFFIKNMPEHIYSK